jgi:hypothetical protein
MLKLNPGFSLWFVDCEWKSLELLEFKWKFQILPILHGNQTGL